jgi:TolA-binding protein
VPALALTLLASVFAAPAQAQDADARLRRLEAEVRAIKRDIGADRTVAPQAVPVTSTTVPGAPASTPMSDLLTRVDALEGQLTRLTSQNEEAGNRIRQLETRLATAEAAMRPAPASDPAAPASAAFVTDGSAPSSNLAAMSSPAATVRPVAAVTAAKPTASGPSAQRLAAVRAVVKPQSSDPGDDEYSYGYRLWDAKLYPEAEQQLKLFLDKYPRHPRVSYARNLMGRALLDENKPREAAPWFLQNYQSDKRGARAPDSLLNLAEAMRQLGDKSRACIALSEFAETFPAEAAGRLKRDYDRTRGGLTCN